jgi:hypothetical protein
MCQLVVSLWALNLRLLPSVSRDHEVQDLHAQLSANHQRLATAEELLAQVQALPPLDAQAAAPEVQELQSSAVAAAGKV